MIPSLDPESDFPVFGDSGSEFGSSKKWNRNKYVMILVRIRSQVFSLLRFRKKWNRNSSSDFLPSTAYFRAAAEEEGERGSAP